jgi:exonuclease SbcC
VHGLVDRAGAGAAGRADGAEAQAAALQRDVAAEQGRAARQAGVDRLERDAAGAEDRVAALELAKEDLPGRITTLQTRLAEATATAARLDAVGRELHAVHRRRDAAARLAELEPQLSELDEARRAAVDAHNRLTEEHLRLLEARLAGIAAELAADLAEGVPCQVCGSTAHPAPAAGSASAVAAEEVERAQQRREAAEAERAQAERAHAELVLETARYEALADGQSVSDLTAEASALAHQAGQAEAAARDAVRLDAELAGAQAEQEQVVKDLRQATEVVAAARAHAALARGELDRLAAELSEAAQGHPSVAARQAALRESAARDRALAKALGTLAGCLAAHASARDRVDAEARAQGFATPAAAAAAVLTAAAQAALEAEVQAWDETLAALTATAEAPDLAGLDPEGADQAEARALAAAAALASAQQAEQELRRAHDEARRKVTRLGQRRDEVSAAEAAYDRLVEQTEAVIGLAGLANGTEGHRRVALTTYVLRHYFGQVVAAANVRLAAMSAGRYELRRTDEGKSRRERSGLTLAVIDRHTGEERSPASLSGGETFYTSLALALGLADVVRAEAGGVDLDTLFIDEGFGSLDSDTLDQVMGVIDDLRERGRVIGIVSHVADLKDRVPERVEVRRLPDGSSTLRVVA